MNFRNISGTEFESKPLCEHTQRTMIRIKGSGLQCSGLQCSDLQSCFMFKNSRFRFSSKRVNIIGDQFSGFLLVSSDK